MHIPKIRTLWSRYHVFCVLAVWLLARGQLHAQSNGGDPLNLVNVTLSGVRSYLTDNWAKIEFTVVNQGSEARNVRLVVFFTTQPDVQYARDVWVPGRASSSSWMLLGPPPPAKTTLSRDVEMLLYDRTGGQERLILPPGEFRVRGRGFLYRSREPITCVLVDRSEPTVSTPPEWSPATEQAIRLLYAYRQTAGLLPIHLEIIPDRFLPASAEALDGVDTFVLAGHRLANDPAGELALRRWLEQGGTLWVMLDLTDPAIVTRLLGDSLPIQVVDRTSLTTLQIVVPGLESREQSPAVELEQAVDFVRVVPTPEDKVLHRINGWPASFTRSFGRGKVLFTTVGAPAWFRERNANDPKSPSESFPDLPVPLQPLLELARKFGVINEPKVSNVEPLEQLVNGEVGYSVPQRTLATMIFGIFFLAALSLGLILQQLHRLELAALGGPVLAVGAAVAFVMLGQASRNAVPPTISAAEIVTVSPATNEQAAEGLVAQYRPDGGVLPVGSTDGGTLELDTQGLQGQTRRRVITDVRDWHWDNLAAPAGLRLGRFVYTVRTGEPLAAVAQLGPEGVTGRISAGPYPPLADAVLKTPTGRPLAVRLDPNGTFHARTEDRLAAGQFLPDVVLSDLQQRRIDVYRKLFTRNEPADAIGSGLLYCWSDHPGMPFTLEPAARTVASSLLAIPLEFVRPAPDTRVSVPGAFVPCQRVLNGKMVLPFLESGSGVDMLLRFQLPRTILPLKVEGARFSTSVRAPQRRFTVAGSDSAHAENAGAKPIELFSGEGLAGPVSVEITQKDLLVLDDQGGLYVRVIVGELPEQAGEESRSSDPRWSMESPELEITGRTLPVE
jgi:hypothetical protein